MPSERAVTAVRWTVYVLGADTQVRFHVQRSGSSDWHDGGCWFNSMHLGTKDLVGLRPAALLARVATLLAL